MIKSPIVRHDHIRRTSENAYWIKEMELCSRSQKFLSIRIERIKDILKLRLKNKKTLEEIGVKYGLSRQRIEQIIKQFHLN